MMKKSIAILLQVMPLLGFAFLLWVHWHISPLNSRHESDPFGAMIAMYFWGFPFLIVSGIVLLIFKKMLHLAWWTGGIALLYAVPYSLELILKEWRIAPHGYHVWWQTHVYPWTGMFFFITMAAGAVYCISIAYTVLRWKMERSEGSPTQKHGAIPTSQRVGRTGHEVWYASDEGARDLKVLYLLLMRAL